MDAQLESIAITTVYSTYLESFFVKWLATTSSTTTLRRVTLSPMSWPGDHRHSPSSLIPHESLPCLQDLRIDCQRLRGTLTSERECYECYAPLAADAMKQPRPRCYHTRA
jgi:hypothetical protein